MSEQPKRVVCLTPETADVLYQLGAADRVVGVSCFAPPPPDGVERPVVSVFTTVKYAAIDALKPDVVIAFSDLQAEVAAELARRGHNVLLTNQRTLKQMLQMIAMVGSLVGRAEEAARLIADLRNAWRTVEAETGPEEPRPVVYFEEWDDPMITGIAWMGELIEAAGGRDAFAELRSQPNASARIVDAERVVARSPQIILASWCGKRVKRETIEQRPGWAALPAVRDGEMYELPSASCLQPGPTLITDGLVRIRQIIRNWQARHSQAAVDVTRT